MSGSAKPGSEGTAAKLPKFPGSQKLTPPSSARAACQATPAMNAATSERPGIEVLFSPTRRFIAICSAREALLQPLHRLIDGERCRALAGRELLVGLEILCDEDDAAGHHRGVGELPVVIGVRRDVRTLERIG